MGTGVVDFNDGQVDGLRRIFAHAAHDERTVLSAAITGVMKRPFKARGADIAWALLQRAANIERRQAKVGPTGFRNSMPVVLHNARELADAATQRALEISKPETTAREYDLLIGLSGPPSRDEIALLEVVDKTYRMALRGHAAELRAKKTETRDPDVDFQILWWLAAGRSQRKIAAHFGIKQQLVNRIKRTRLQTIYREVIEPLMPTVSRPVPKGIKSDNPDNQFGGRIVYVSEQRNYRTIGRDRTTRNQDH